MSVNSKFKLSQGYEVLRPKDDKMFPIPCAEWDVLRSKVDSLTTEPWLFHTTGSTFVGAALATAISVWTGAVSTASLVNAIVIAWAVTAVCLICGLACLWFAHKEREVHRGKASDVVTQMKLIEQRFEHEEI